MNVKIFAHSGQCEEEAKQKVLNEILVFRNISEAIIILIIYNTETLNDKVIAEAKVFYDIKK